MITRLLGAVTGNPTLLVWIVLSAFAAGAGSAWTVQGWRMGKLQAEYDSLVVTTRVIGEQAKKDKERIEKEHATVTKEIKDAIPKQIAAARSSAVAAYRLRYPDTGGRCVPNTTDSASGTDAAGKEPVAAGWTGTAAPAFVEDCAQDAAMIGWWQGWARAIGFPVQ